MSIIVANAVWERFEGASGELLLALALADHASDDGTKIFPSVKRLAKMTRQSERTVQIQLRKMEARGWLQLVENAQGGRSKARVYRVNPSWLKGEAIAAPFNEPVDELPAVEDDEKGCSSERERVQSTTLKGEAATAPEPSVTIKEPSGKRASRASVSLRTYLDQCQAEDRDPIASTASVFNLAEAKGIPNELIALAWAEFKRHHLPNGKSERTKQADWPKTFRNAVDGNWYRLWWTTGDGVVEATSSGREAKNLHDRLTRQHDRIAA